MTANVATFRIRHASDDRNSVLQTTVSCRHFIRDRNIDVYASRQRQHISKEPTIESITQNLKNTLNIISLARTHGKAGILLRIGKCGYLVSLRKIGGRYNINGTFANVDIILKAIARTVMRSAFLNQDSEEAQDALDDYLIRCITVPENVSYAMENRVPYKFFERTETGVEERSTRLSLMRIAETNYALEISSGVWGEINAKNLNTFINNYLYNKKQGKWFMISPAELWFRTVGTKGTPAQVKIMKEFLKQNRRSDLAEQRAMQLFNDMVNKYDVVTKGTFVNRDNQKVLCMYIRGKLADWMVVDNQSKRGIQDVSTYVLTSKTLGENDIMVEVDNVINNTEEQPYWAGPICIDNLSSGASVGDQFAARAFACMNDPMLVKLVSTVGRYIRGHEEGQEEVRLDWDAVCKLSEQAPEIKDRN
tara:strand:+ start:2076 stop:3338 length:1263 start_codon:yes stop_codon:yes gene_type:complete